METPVANAPKQTTVITPNSPAPERVQFVNTFLYIYL